jgi:hypothetical protein
MCDNAAKILGFNHLQHTAGHFHETIKNPWMRVLRDRHTALKGRDTAVHCQ